MSHQHDWQTVSHADGCHWWASIAVCGCGATLQEYGERDIADDPYAYVWMEDDQMDAVQCWRCRELLNGATPDTRTEVVAAR